LQAKCIQKNRIKSRGEFYSASNRLKAGLLKPALPDMMLKIKYGGCIMKVGDVVQLKSGGPLMTVSDIEDEDVYCNWFDKNNKLVSSSFRLLQLKIVDENKLNEI
jgi:uncharacterized protein YodC (DUF2158 family)